MWTFVFALVSFYVATLSGFLWAMRFAPTCGHDFRVAANDNVVHRQAQLRAPLI